MRYPALDDKYFYFTGTSELVKMTATRLETILSVVCMTMTGSTIETYSDTKHASVVCL